MKLNSLSILIPAYNVQSTIATVVKQAYAEGQKAAKICEIIVIDDGSTDKTNKELRIISRSIPVLKIINHNTNLGYGQTIQELYTKGTKEWLFSLPGDHQFDANVLTGLLKFTNNADMILGRRVERKDSISRIIQSRVYNTLLKILFKLDIHDINTIRLMKQSIITTIPLSSKSAFVDAELTIKAHKNGFKIIEIPVDHRERKQKGATGGKFFSTILPTIVDMIRMTTSL